MLGTYSYNEIFRKTIVAFGTLFNNIEIRRQDEVMKVPLAYGPQQKFLARLDQNPDPTNKRVQITLPRLSFEINGVSYDPQRKVSPTQKIKFKKDTDENKNVFMPVPYNIGFELAIISKNQDDGLQIIEQILPFFQPHYNLAVKLLTTVGEIKDVPVVLNSINYQDDYEGDFTSRRAIIYTLSFTAKTYLYGPVTDSKVIKKAITDYYTSTSTTAAPRQVRYQATPVAIKDYDEDDTARTNEAFDTKKTEFDVNNATPFKKGDYIQIDDEKMLIRLITGNRLKVRRGEFGSVIAPHDIDVKINGITVTDDPYVESGDDFGFGETKTEYGDGSIYSVAQGWDSDI